MTTPYIGVTGFMNWSEVDEVLKAVPPDARHKLMVGVLASSKTLRGVRNKYPERYPAMLNVMDIFPDHPAVLNLIHFNTEPEDDLLTQLKTLSALGGPNFHGFQLNIAWPEPYTLRRYREFRPQDRLVLQCGSKAMLAVGNNPVTLAERFALYRDTCDTILIDPSGGKGQLLEPEAIAYFVKAILRLIPGATVGIAGGLSPETLDVIAPLARDYPDLCIDAEGRLRDKDDKLNLERARAYVEKAYQLFAIPPEAA